MARADALVQHRERKRTLTAMADPVEGVTAGQAHNRIRAAVEAMEPPQDCKPERGGEYEHRQDACKAGN